jgi:uncharacterized protein (DUF433 family)
MDYRSIITPEPGKRCIELSGSGMTETDILNDFPDLTKEDIGGCLAFAAGRERRLASTLS